MAKEKGIKYLYSDGATSCIIVTAVGQNSHKDPIVTLAHISRPQGFDVFFKEVLGKNFVGPVKFYAQGANPPQSEMPEKIKAKLLSLAADNTSPDRKWHFSSVYLSLGQGDPLKNNRDSFGINLNNLEVSNKPFPLKYEERDPTGVLSVYGVAGRKLNPPIWLKNAQEPFAQKTLNDMMELAYRSDYKDLMSKSPEQLVKEWSTTPDMEVDWFVDLIKMEAKYLSEHYKGASSKPNN